MTLSHHTNKLQQPHTDIGSYYSSLLTLSLSHTHIHTYKKKAKFITLSTRGKTRKTHHLEVGHRETNSVCLAMWHKASIFLGLWKRLCTIPAAAALVVGQGTALILCTSSPHQRRPPYKKKNHLKYKITSKSPLRCNN